MQPLWKGVFGLALALYVVAALILGLVGDALRMLEASGPWLSVVPVLWLLGAVGLALLLVGLWVYRRRT